SIPPVVVPSPATAKTLDLSSGTQPIAVSVMPAGDDALVVLREPDGPFRVVRWHLADGTMAQVADLPAGFEAAEIVAHPRQPTAFVVGRSGTTSAILSVTRNGSMWESK